jgi:hypothetical protein
VMLALCGLGCVRLVRVEFVEVNIGGAGLG